MDTWSWKPEKEGVFTVKSCYSLLQNLWLVEGALSYEEEGVFRDLWKSKAPPKVLAFSWTLFLDRLPTKVNLAKRRLVGVEVSKQCVFCGGDDETAVNLFLHCDMISKVWRKVMKWLNVNFITPPNLFIHVICWAREVWSKKLRRGAWLIWRAVVSVIWNTRNNRIFNNKVLDVGEMVDQIKVTSWQ